MGNRKDCLHVFGQRLAKGDGVRRKSAAPVPLNCNSLSNRLATVRYANDPQCVAVHSLKGWDDSHALPSLRQRKQDMGRPTLQENIGLDVREAASCVKQSPDGIASIEQQQGIRREAADIDDVCVAELEGRGAGTQSVSRWQDATLEAGIALIKSDTHVNFAAFEQGCLLGTECFAQLDIHVGKTLGVSRKKPRQHTLDGMRWRGDFHHPSISAPKYVCAFAHGVEIGHHAATIRKKLLAFCSQGETASDPVKQPEPQLLLKITELSRKRRLPDTQAQRGLRYRAEFGDGNKGSQTPQIHCSILCRMGMEYQSNYALDVRPFRRHVCR
jgi:hypothetical protein